MLSDIIVKIILSVVVISSFIGIFFFTYESKIEANIVRNQSSEIIKDCALELRELLPDQALQSLYDVVEPSLVAPDLSNEDLDVKTSNDALIKKVVRMIVIFTSIGFLLVALLCLIFKINPKDMLISTALTLVFVAAAEYIFVTYLVQNYSTIDANFVKRKILNILANYH